MKIAIFSAARRLIGSPVTVAALLAGLSNSCVFDSSALDKIYITEKVDAPSGPQPGYDPIAKEDTIDMFIDSDDTTHIDIGTSCDYDPNNLPGSIMNVILLNTEQFTYPADMENYIAGVILPGTGVMVADIYESAKNSGSAYSAQGFRAEYMDGSANLETDIFDALKSDLGQRISTTTCNPDHDQLINDLFRQLVGIPYGRFRFIPRDMEAIYFADMQDIEGKSYLVAIGSMQSETGGEQPGINVVLYLDGLDSTVQYLSDQNWLGGYDGN